MSVESRIFVKVLVGEDSAVHGQVVFVGTPHDAAGREGRAPDQPLPLACC